VVRENAKSPGIPGIFIVSARLATLPVAQQSLLLCLAHRTQNALPNLGSRQVQLDRIHDRSLRVTICQDYSLVESIALEPDAFPYRDAVGQGLQLVWHLGQAVVVRRLDQIINRARL